MLLFAVPASRTGWWLRRMAEPTRLKLSQLTNASRMKRSIIALSHGGITDPRAHKLLSPDLRT